MEGWAKKAIIMKEQREKEKDIVRKHIEAHIETR